MPWVTRTGGVVTGAFVHKQAFTSEYLDEAHPDVVAYRQPKTPPVSEFDALKAALIRKGHVSQSDIDDEKAR